MTDTFLSMRGHVHPLFWPVLWLNLALIWVRYGEACVWLELRLTEFGGVRVARVYADPVPDWRDAVWAAAPRLSVAGVRRIICAPPLRLARFGRRCAALMPAQAALSFCGLAIDSPPILDSS
ncbi:MAG: hypothetical protein AAFS03_04720 [Pseudomonadota bacterium]